MKKNRRFVKWIPLFGIIYIMLNAGNISLDFGINNDSPSFFISSIVQGVGIALFLYLTFTFII